MVPSRAQPIRFAAATTPVAKGPFPSTLPASTICETMLTSIQRGRGLAWFGLLVVLAEVVGESLTAHVDRRLHVMPLAPSHASYYPFLLVAVKVAAALALAALLVRITRLRATKEAGERLLVAAGHHGARRLPRLRTSLSPRAWLASFAGTSVAYLVQMNTSHLANRHLPLFAPWLHTYALPMYAMLAVVVSFVWGLRLWLRDAEDHAVGTLNRARRILRTVLGLGPVHSRPFDGLQPRRRFGLSLDSRPPPLTA